MKNLITVILFLTLCFSSYSFAGTYTINNKSGADIIVWKENAGSTPVPRALGVGSKNLNQGDYFSVCWAEQSNGNWKCSWPNHNCCYTSKPTGQMTITGTPPNSAPNISGDVNNCSTSGCP